MKLRIIDNTQQHHLRIELSYIDLAQAKTDTVAPVQVHKETFDVDDFNSPFSSAFLNTLNWYFSDFPTAIEQTSASEKKAQTRAQEVMTKFIKAGQHLGDALLGENHTLNKFRELIEERGYHQCEVQIESSRIAFFELPWEALILPESNYLLSTTAASFKRVFVNPNSNSATPDEINLKLNVSGPTQQQLQQMIGSDTGNANLANASNEPHTPLNVLTLSHGHNKQISPTHLAQQSVLTELAFDTALNINLAVADSITSLNHTLRQHQPHIVCLTGQIELENGEAFWCGDTSYLSASHKETNEHEKASIPCRQLFELLKEQAIPLLILNIDSYQQEGAEVPASTGLAFVSCLAQQAGIHNLIGFNTSVNGFIRQQILTGFYQQLTKGLTVAQAVVETRKQLQSESSAQALSVTDHTIQIWPLLSHYGNQRVVFFESAPPQIDAQMGIENAQQTQQIFQHLFGFLEDFMPVRSVSGRSAPGNLATESATRFDNGEFIQLANALQSGTTTSIVSGKQGSGKTLLAHAVAFYAVQKQLCTHAFRFDFSTHQYSQQDMLTMMAPVLGVATSSSDNEQQGSEKQGTEQQSDFTAAVLDKLKTTRCLLVLENLENETAEQSNTQTLIENFTAAGQSIVITTAQDHAQWQHINSDTQIRLTPLTASQTLGVLATFQPPQHSANQQEAQNDKAHGKEHDKSKNNPALFTMQQHALTMAQHCQFNPWLIHKLGAFLPQLSQSNTSESLQAAWQDNIDSNLPKTSFYTWQWQQIPEGLQYLLLICSEFGDILLEMLMVAWEREKAISDDITALLLDMSSKNAGEPAQHSESLFNHEIPNFSAAITQWKQQGFVQAKPHGHIIDRDARAFLQPRLNDSQLHANQPLQLLVSRLLCAGLRILADHVLRQQNPAIFRNLLNNRGLWAQQLQKLWTGECFGEFIKTKSVIEQLMQQAQLGDEFASWAGTLLQQINGQTPQAQTLPSPERLSAKQAEHHIAWFSVAVSALKSASSVAQASQHNQSSVSTLLAQAAEQSQQWLAQAHNLLSIVDNENERNKEQALPAHRLAMVQHCNSFLTQYFSQAQHWQQVIHCNQQSLELLEQAQAWPLVSSILMTLANANVQLNHHDVAKAHEDRIIFAVPYQHAPAGYRSQKIVDVIINRIQRQDVASLKPLITELEQSDDANRWQEFLTGVKADMAFAEQRWKDALPYYAKMWQQVAMQLQSQQMQPQPGQTEQVQQQLNQQHTLLLERLHNMEKALSANEFKAQFCALVGDDTPLPSAILAATNEQ